MIGEVQQNQNQTPDDQIGFLQFDFTGEWVPDRHSMTVKNGDFTDCQNIRFNKAGDLVSVNGYTKINSVALSSYPQGRNGFQLRTPHTQKSYIFTQQFDSSGANGRVYMHKGVPPATGDFDSVLHVNTTESSQGYFAEAPDNNMVYCNGVETLVYAGEESIVAAAIKITSISGIIPTDPIDITGQMRNTLQTADNIATLTNYLLASTRPLQGMKPYISTAGAAGTTSVKYWSGATWASVSGLVDNSAGHTVTGTIAWNSTLATAKPVIINDQLLYWYLIEVSGGGAVVYHITYNAPIQKLIDLWDGVNRVVTTCQVSRDSVYEDYTAEVYDSSTIYSPIAAKFAGINSTDHIILMFEERTTAMRFSFLAGLSNIDANTLTVSTWNGSAWVSVGTLHDSTMAETAAHATLTSNTGPVSNGETIVLDTKSYTFKTTLTPAEGEVLIGANYTVSLDNLKSAINHEGAPDIDYKCAAAHPTVKAVVNTNAKQMFIARTVGVSGNSIVTTETSANLAFDGAVMHGGGVSSMAQTGIVYWNPPDLSIEQPRVLFGIYGYAYKLSWSGQLTPDTEESGKVGCYPDTIYGIPAVRSMGSYKFSFNYRNRLFLAGDVTGKEGHSIDYSIADAADSFSGTDGSGKKQRLYIGKNSSDLVGATNVFNRFGTNLFNSELLLKPTETYLLDGDSPENFQVSQISDNVGCAAPRTICTAEVAFEVSKDAIRNIAMWISGVGPMLFDAAVLVPLKGIGIYFTPGNSNCVNFDALCNAHAWFDPFYYEWNVCLPVGNGQTTCNVWLAYNLLEKKWTKRNVGLQRVPQAVIKVVDDSGNMYFYGLIDSGHMIRLEHGTLWNEIEAIESFVTTNSMLPTGKMFDITNVRSVKFLLEGTQSGVADIVYSRGDIEIRGQGIESGDLRIYGRLIEDSGCTASYWDGEDFRCKELREYQTITGANWTDVDGVVSIIGKVTESWTMDITTVTGDFVAAGFRAGLLLTTDDPSNIGPFLIDSVATKAMVLSTGKATDFQAGAMIILRAMLAAVWYYPEGETIPIPLPFSSWELKQEWAKIMCSCGKVGLTHKFKFVFYSTVTNNNLRPIAWGIQYLLERNEP